MVLEVGLLENDVLNGGPGVSQTSIQGTGCIHTARPGSGVQHVDRIQCALGGLRRRHPQGCVVGKGWPVTALDPLPQLR